MKIDGVLLKKTEEYREKNGIYVTDDKSKIYVGFKLATTLSLIWVAATNILVCLSFLYLYLGGNGRGDIQTPIVVGAITLVTLIGYFFSMYGAHLVGAPLVFLSNLAGFLLFMHLQTDVANSFEIGLQGSFYYRHAIPLALLTICIISLAYIGVRAKQQLKRDAKQVLAKMYATLKAKNSDFSEDVWHDFLEKEGISVKVADKL